MRISKRHYPPLAIAVMLFAAVGAGMLFNMLWREYLLYAIAATALLFCVAPLLPDRNIYVHGLSLGVCLGAFCGGAVGAAKCFAPNSTLTFNRSLERTYTSWPRYAPGLIIATCGQPVSAAQLLRWAS